MTKQPNSQNFPTVLEYLDYRAYLNDVLEHWNLEGRLSGRWLAKRSGFQSAGHLSMILKGQRRLAPNKVGPIATAIKLNPDETEYFRLIVSLDHCKTQSEQQEILNRIKTQFQNGIFEELNDSALGFLRHWYYPAVLELSELADFEACPQWIARKLGIAVGDAEASVDFLIRNGYFQEEDGDLSKSQPSLHTSEKHFSPVIGQFHLQMLEKSFQAASLPRDRRYFECLTFSMNREKRNDVVSTIKKFFRELDVMIEGDEKCERDDVVQLNMQFFSLLERGETSDT